MRLGRCHFWHPEDDCEDRLTAHVETETKSRAAQGRDHMVERQRPVDDDRASMVAKITAGSMKLKQVSFLGGTMQ